MGKEKMLDLFHKQLRVNAEAPGYRREETTNVVRHVSEYEDEGFILASSLDEDNAKKIIREEIEYFNKIGQRFEWKVYSYDQPSNLSHILKEEEFEEGDPEALMVLELTPKSPLLTHTHPNHLVEIETEAGIKEIISLIDGIWEGSHAELGKRLWRDKQEDPDSLHLYGVYEDNRLVSGAWMYFEPKSSFASLWGGATREGYRKKGYYSALLAARAQKAFDEGYRFLTVDASPMSRPILEKSGFQCLAYTYGMQSPEK